MRRSFTGRTYVSPSPASVKRYSSWSRPDIKVAMSTIIPKPELAGDDSRSHVRDASWKDQVQVAEGQDTTLIIDRLEFLLASAHSHRWYMCLGGKGIQRSFRFKTFKQTWDFMQAVAEKCKSERHHPEWWNVCIIDSLESLIPCKRSNLIYRHTIIHSSNGQPISL